MLSALRYSMNHHSCTTQLSMQSGFEIEELHQLAGYGGKQQRAQWLFDEEVPYVSEELGTDMRLCTSVGGTVKGFVVFGINHGPPL